MRSHLQNNDDNVDNDNDNYTEKLLKQEVAGRGESRKYKQIRQY